MKWLAVAGAATFAVFLLSFLIGEFWRAPWLTDPAAQFRRADLMTALLGVELLVADAALPTPASLVMITLGAVFGAVLGTLLAAIGTMGATLAAFAGAVPTALIYALTGATAAGSGSGTLVFAATLAVAGGGWLADRQLARRLARHRGEAAITAGSAP
jgi:uncharacterized membrane protein YdjX (TVP38/TMEM64 family)